MNQYAVIVDFSHLFHLSKAVALNAGPQYDLKDTTIANVVGKLRTIKHELSKLQIVGYDLVFVEDRPALRKMALLPGYKANRSDTTEEKNEVKQYLLQNGHITRFCWSEGNEADDAIATVLRLALAQGDLSCVIVTGDRDLWSLIQPRVQVYNPIKQQMVTDDDVEKAFKCRPIHIPLVKALWGDSGDCVPNVVPRTQKQLYPAILESDGSLFSFKSNIDAKYRWFLTEKCYDAYLKAEQAIERNYALVKLDDQCDLVWE